MAAFSIRVEVEQDRVVIDLGGRRRDLLLSCSQAYALADGLDAAAAFALAEAPALALGESWGVQVESYDGLVAVRFDPPHVGAPERVPMTPQAARKVAEMVRFKASQAEHKMRLVVKGA
jgi:hypothetical protein